MRDAVEGEAWAVPETCRLVAAEDQSGASLHRPPVSPRQRGRDDAGDGGGQDQLFTVAIRDGKPKT